MTIDQAKKLLRICKLQSARVRVVLYQGSICAQLTGKMYYHSSIRAFTVSNNGNDFVIYATDRVKIERSSQLYILKVFLTGKRCTYAKVKASVPAIDMLNQLTEETTP